MLVGGAVHRLDDRTGCCSSAYLGRVEALDDALFDELIEHEACLGRIPRDDVLHGNRRVMGAMPLSQLPFVRSRSVRACRVVVLMGERRDELGSRFLASSGPYLQYRELENLLEEAHVDLNKLGEEDKVVGPNARHHDEAVVRLQDDDVIF